MQIQTLDEFQLGSESDGVITNVMEIENMPDDELGRGPCIVTSVSDHPATYTLEVPMTPSCSGCQL